MKHPIILALFAFCCLFHPAHSVALPPPHGLYEIGGDAFTNINITGYKAELTWSDGNPADGVYDWSRIDGLVASARLYHKQLGISLRILSQPPAWVTALPGVVTYNTRLGRDPMVMPFDTIVQPKIVAFIQAFCQHFDNQLNYVVLGGMGYKTESLMPLPSEIGLNMTIEDYTAAWKASRNLFVDTYSANLAFTPFVLAAAVPFVDPGANQAITDVMNYGLIYPHYGMTQWGLKATSNSTFFINNIILTNDFNRATGFELIGASDGSSGGDLQGTLAQALAAGGRLGADWIEIYAVDAMNSQYVRILSKFNKLLK
jgi:hypothetical protein